MLFNSFDFLVLFVGVLTICMPLQRCWQKLFLLAASFTPLAGSRGGRLETYRNLSIAQLFGGLWHGAAWTKGAGLSEEPRGGSR